LAGIVKSEWLKTMARHKSQRNNPCGQYVKYEFTLGTSQD